jgi:chemotaxis protein methyltransferase CheR
MREVAVDDVGIDLVLDGLYRQYGYDFRSYSRPSLERRLQTALERSGCKTLRELLDRLLADPLFFRKVVSDLTVNVTEMFRDPEVYSVLRREVIPLLRTYPSLKIWHAGCATGEEVYSMAILLKEEGLLDRSFLYGTDISPRVVEAAKEGLYPATQIQAYTANYQKAGGVESFADYYVTGPEGVRIDPSFRKHILFSQHNLASDDNFAEFNLVFCRNVLIYFSQELQSRALGLMRRALVHRGILVLGTKETVDFTSEKDSFEILHKHERIYRKV